jgi:hypothetical protein
MKILLIQTFNVRVLQNLKEKEMARKVCVILIITTMAAGGLFAQERNEGLWARILSNQGFAPGIEGARFFINGGIGFELPFLSSFGHNMPPVSASFDYVFSGMPLSLGGKIAFSTLKWGGAAIDECINIDIALRAVTHSKILGSIENLDVYALVSLGFDFATGDGYDLWKNLAASRANNFTGFYMGLGLGGRYFFTNHIGAYLEADFKLIQKFSVGANVGLALKF